MEHRGLQERMPPRAGHWFIHVNYNAANTAKRVDVASPRSSTICSHNVSVKPWKSFSLTSEKRQTFLSNAAVSVRERCAGPGARLYASGNPLGCCISRQKLFEPVGVESF